MAATRNDKVPPFRIRQPPRAVGFPNIVATTHTLSSSYTSGTNFLTSFNQTQNNDGISNFKLEAKQL
jgi:hypothetical protein